MSESIYIFKHIFPLNTFTLILFNSAVILNISRVMRVNYTYVKIMRQTVIIFMFIVER